ncbi:TPA: hypothetical protein ACOEBF_001082 [Stenotrophomonas maltophilia]|nr:hypothetical protein [Stenotrophomonas maltophilia]HEL4115975.1 hypothetical protein [Stenotrophomonas maltophilia]
MKKPDLTASIRANARGDARSIPHPGLRHIREAALSRAWIDSKLLEDESALQELAWIEYRYMTPLARTELFSKMYFEAYLRAYAKRFPGEDVSKKRPCEIDFERNSTRVMNALWRARATADVAGVPYEVFLDTVLESHLIKDRWKNPPRPNQLYGKLVMPRVQGLLTNELVAERLYGVNWDRRFFAAEYRGDPVQKSALALLARIVNESEDPAEKLAEYLCDRRAITVEAAKEVFDVDLTRRAIQHGEQVPVESGAATPKPFVPACVGYYWDNEDSQCQFCPVKLNCIQVSERVSEDVRTMTGSVDPRGDHMRKKGRERQQRLRDKRSKAEMIQRLGADSLNLSTEA